VGNTLKISLLTGSINKSTISCADPDPGPPGKTNGIPVIFKEEAEIEGGEMTPKLILDETPPLLLKFAGYHYYNSKSFSNFLENLHQQW
jgi:hypothetical protein